MTRVRSRLNIFIDETGEFGLGKYSAKLYGVSFVLHESTADIRPALSLLDTKFRNYGFHGTVHMGDLINGHGEFEGMTIEERKRIYLALYNFAKQIDAKYRTVFVRKKYSDSLRELGVQIERKIEEFYQENMVYLQSFDKINVYYDQGQKLLGRIVDNVFGRSPSYVRRDKFNHREKKLFQVADMLTYLDKLIYRLSIGEKLTRNEQRFFTARSLQRTERALRRKRSLNN